MGKNPVNKYICSGKKSLEFKNCKIPKDISDDIVIKDIITDEGRFLSLQQFNAKFSTNLDNLCFNKIISAIPYKWKEKLRKTKISCTVIKDTTVSCQGKLKDITKVSNKALYWIALHKNIQEPTAVEKWIETFPFLESISWHKIFKMAHIISNEPYLHSFQYKILNRILNNNYNLYKWKLKDSPICVYCDEIDTIEHHLFHCVRSSLFWTRLQKWICNAFKVKHETEFTICEILFGTGIDTNLKTAYNYCKNFIVLIGKWYINYIRSENKTLIFEEYLAILQAKLKIYVTKFNCPKTYERVDSEIQNNFSFLLRRLQKG